MKPSIIIQGPMACGKTRNAERLAKHYRLSRVIDTGAEWQTCPTVPMHDTLLLAVYESDYVNPHGVRVIQFEDAMKEMSK